MADFPLSALRSAELDVPDLAAAERFYTGPWGLAVVARAPGALWLRATGADHHVLVLREAATPALRTPALRAMAFRAASAAALHALCPRAVAAGATLLAPPAPLAEPGGGLGALLRLPDGVALKLVCGDERLPPLPPDPSRPERLAHLNLNCRDVDATARFLEGGLGFALSDRSRLMAFERCNSDHHALVLAEAPVNGLNHVAFLMPGWEGVMLGAGRLVDAGFPIGWGVGRHGPGDNVFAYFVDPFGIVVEYTAEVEQVGEDHVPRGPEHWVWPPGRSDHWGIAPPKPEATKRAQLAIGYAP
ncbi:VOC family protein [Roseomonas sp. GC11]|uniref:VOC family protein n=1 Tax=Roseomonas sp. GC11 TaxID=2950546 RepID=UPI0021090707|nr:VOC family protein [Roseomonas sp. GC11]MCQ4158617.1 VOC family protein [Roseomonas sp. GC11]